MRCDFFVEIVFPLQPLGDGFDDEVAVLELGEMLFIVGRLNQICQGRHTEWSRVLFFERLNRFHGDGALRALRWGCGQDPSPVLGGQVKQYDRHPGVDEVRCNLRAHHTGTEHGNFFDDEIGHGFFPIMDSA